MLYEKGEYQLFSIIVKSESKDSKLLSRWKKYIIRKKYFVETMNNGKITYAKININDPKSVDWNNIKLLLGKTLDRVILQKEFENINTIGLKNLDITEYYNNNAKIALEYILLNSSLKLKYNKLMLIDINGQFLDYAKIMIKYCSRLKIVTNNLIKYNAFREYIMENLGAVAIITDELTNFQDTILVVSPNSDIFNFNIDHRTPVISETQKYLSNSCIYHSFLPILNDDIQKDIPNNIDPYVYIGGVFKYYKVNLTQDLIPNKCKCGNRSGDILEIINIINSY